MTVYPRDLLQMPAPEAPKRRHRLEAHDDVRIDDYYWLRERNDPQVHAYLEAENSYVDESLGHTRELQAELFDEIKGRIKQTDVSVPYREGTYRYYWRHEDGKEYPVHCRQPLSSEVEQVVLDVNRLAFGHEYCDVGTFVISPDEHFVAYAIDTVGRRQYDIRFSDLATGEALPDVIPSVTANCVWASDSRTLLYARQHPTTLRSHQVCRHVLGHDVLADQLVFEEADEMFVCGVRKSRSKRYILIGSYHTLTTEYRVLDAQQPDGCPWVFESRQSGHEYHIDHYHDRFFIRSNANATNFRLLAVDHSPEAGPDDRHLSRERWREIVAHRDGVLLETFELFRDHLVTQERADGLVQLRVRPWGGDAEHAVEFPEPVYEAFIDAHNKEPDTSVLRFGYSSLTTPESDYDYDMVTRERTLLKREEVLGEFDRANYRTERVFATASDGVQVPISLVARRQTPRDGSSPLLLIGYGSYGISTNAGFRSPRLSLLDRGFTFAIAHVRGGQELGRQWYDDGRLMNKKNTFTDFIACAEQLVADRYTSPSRLFAMGGSAGGLLMGAVVNMRPDLFNGVIAQVPFVDVVTTMLDESIPLTTGEYDEWGDPNDPDAYQYIKSYSPYDNVTTQTYPHMLVMTGLHDSQVQYWESAKWVAKLRALRTDNHILVLKTNMDAGHGGSSARYERYRETALQYAFLIDRAGGIGHG